MTLSELIAELQEIEEEHGGTDGQVMIATQPAWPMEYETDRVGVTEDGTVYIAVGQQMGYLQDDGAVAIRWSPESV